MKKSWNNSGFSLVGTQVAMGLIAVALVFCGSLLYYHVTATARVDRHVLATQVAAGIAANLQRSNWSDVTSLCAGIGAAVDPCLASGGKEITSTVTAPAKIGLALDRRLDAVGSLSAEGFFCVTLSKCTTLITEQLQELTLAYFFTDPKAGTPPQKRFMSFRKARW